MRAEVHVVRRPGPSGLNNQVSSVSWGCDWHVELTASAMEWTGNCSRTGLSSTRILSVSRGPATQVTDLPVALRLACAAWMFSRSYRARARWIRRGPCDLLRFGADDRVLGCPPLYSGKWMYLQISQGWRAILGDRSIIACTVLTGRLCRVRALSLMQTNLVISP